eukprot:3662095-Pleurochrysis_carterae.AAC.1
MVFIHPCLKGCNRVKECFSTHFSEQGSLCCISLASEARPALSDDSTLASKARPAPTSKARSAFFSD